MMLEQTSSSRDCEDPDLVGGVAISPARSPVAGTAKANFIYKGGLVLKNVYVQLIFWGTVWGTSENHPTFDEVKNAVTSILTGQYMSLLDQYQGIGNGVLDGTASVNTPVANSPANPPNPFADNDVQTLVLNLINSRAIPDPASNNQLLYCVVMPPGVNCTKRHIIGQHSLKENVHYAWITNGGTLASVTKIFSHELVESCTDPEGDAFNGTSGMCRGGGWCEIGDVCETVDGVVDGITVQAYWSQQNHTCVVPI